MDALFPTITSIQIAAIIITYCIIATLLIPGKWVKGALLPDNTRISYKMNGLAVQFFGMVGFTVGGLLGFYRLAIIVEQYKPLIITLLIFSGIFSLFLYLRAAYFIDKKYQRFHSNWFIINYWIGGELNPHIFGFEIKEFAYRPGFVTVSIICISAMAKQYELYGTLSSAMILFQLISAFYALDCFYYESGLITMFDIIEENFGFMLCFGDFMWIPWVFSLQSVYLVPITQENHLSIVYIFLNILVLVVGYVLFRGANNQKIQFKNDDKKPIWGNTPKYIKTETGSKLLISGFWGIGRKINYLGDILVAIAMSMPCTTISVIPYLYPIYLTALLIHRAHRDNQRCQAKYGKYWTQYCKEVPYMIIPFVF